jgi:S1-C subfamily serine protease
MRMRLLAAAAAAAAVCGTAGPGARAQSLDDRAAARDVVRKRSDAVVMVLATVKLRLTIAGREQTTDQAAQTNATVLDASGLAVLSLSQLQPDDMVARRFPSTPGSRVEVTSEPSDIRMHLADGRELPARLVLRDEDLDLAFIRPIEPPSPPITFVDAASAKPALLDLLTAVQRTSESTSWVTAASFATVQLVIDKPRTYYQVAGGGGLGSPLFDLSGRFVGVTLMRNTGTRGSGTPGVLPAEDIREVAKQAPAVK